MIPKNNNYATYMNNFSHNYLQPAKPMNLQKKILEANFNQSSNKSIHDEGASPSRKLFQRPILYKSNYHSGDIENGKHQRQSSLLKPSNNLFTSRKMDIIEG